MGRSQGRLHTSVAVARANSRARPQTSFRQLERSLGASFTVPRELSFPLTQRAMAFRLATIQRQVLAGDSAVSGGLLPCRVSEDSDFEKRVQEMKAWMSPSEQT